jgi:radical SAM-linked protein
MMRIFKRADVEMIYSEGFKLRPLISFGPALTLGISSMSEFFDIRVKEPWENKQDILDRLQAHSENGIIFKNINEIEKKTKSIQEAVDEFTYFVPLKDDSSADADLATFESMEKIIVESFSKKKRANIKRDIKPNIKSVTIGNIDLDQALVQIIDEVSPCKNKGFVIKAQVKSGTSVRPMDIIKGLSSIGIEVERPIKVASRIV